VPNSSGSGGQWFHVPKPTGAPQTKASSIEMEVEAVPVADAEAARPTRRLLF
jgi:hypothetical protein